MIPKMMVSIGSENPIVSRISSDFVEIIRFAKEEGTENRRQIVSKNILPL